MHPVILRHGKVFDKQEENRMAIQLTVKDYTEYLKLAYEKIHREKDYITALDSATGDGDHWVNIDLGFEALLKQLEEISIMDFGSAFHKIGMIMMSVMEVPGAFCMGRPIWKRLR